MRLSYGRLTRDLPRAEITPGDLVVTKTCFCGEQPDEHYVTPATSFLPEAWHQERQRLGTFRTRKEAVAHAWKLLALRQAAGVEGGRLLDWQRGHMAEQPFLFRLSFKRALTDEEKSLFQRGKLKDRKLILALEKWAGLPKKDARTFARKLIAKGETLIPLTQTEIRATYQPSEMRPAIAEVWSLIQASLADRLPDALQPNALRPPSGRVSADDLHLNPPPANRMQWETPDDDAPEHLAGEG
jgi:hypothetical protein